MSWLVGFEESEEVAGMDRDCRNVPSFFVCPISLQVMSEPVTICTGISFDRDSIQKWLFYYKKTTCPVTKQPLSDFVLTPNNNLLRLIQSWLDNKMSPTRFPGQDEKLDHQDHDDLLTPLNKILEDIEQPHLQVSSLKKIKSLVNGGNWRVVGDHNSIFSHVAQVLIADKTELTLHSRGGETFLIIDEAMSILSLLNPSDETLKTVSENTNSLFIMRLCSFLTHCSINLKTRIQIVSLLKSIFNVVGSIHKTGLKAEFFESITEILKDQNSKHGTIAVLTILMQVLQFGQNKERAIGAGIVPVLVELLAEINDQRYVNEMMLAVLEKLCKTAQGRAVFLSNPLGIAAVMSKVLRVSHVGNDKAISLLLQIFRFCNSSKIAQEFIEVGGVNKICMVIQSARTSTTTEKARKILGFHENTWKKSPCFPSFFQF